MSSDQISDEAWEHVAKFIILENLEEIDVDYSDTDERKYGTIAEVRVRRSQAIAAQAELDRANEISDAEIDAVYNLRLRGHEPVDTGCAITNAKAIIRQELVAAKKALEAVKHE